MPIPNMPSVAKHYRGWTTPVLVQADLPCRLVPTLWGGRARQADAFAPAWTHYVDVPGNTDIRGTFHVQPGTSNDWQWAIVYQQTDFLVICSCSDVKFFMVLWVEDRYVDTESYYKRVYVVGQRSGNVAPFPCP